MTIYAISDAYRFDKKHYRYGVISAHDHPEPMHPIETVVTCRSTGKVNARQVTLNFADFREGYFTSIRC